MLNVWEQKRTGSPQIELEICGGRRRKIYNGQDNNFTLRDQTKFRSLDCLFSRKFGVRAEGTSEEVREEREQSARSFYTVMDSSKLQP